MGVPLAGRTSGERSRVKCLVPARPARRGKVLDEVSAAIPGDASRREPVIEQFLYNLPIKKILTKKFVYFMVF